MIFFARMGKIDASLNNSPSLFGMLKRTFILPRVHTDTETYTSV